jgi:large subunit ribosomal protein L21
MYAIVETGGKQYRVKPGDTVAVERLSGEPGETLDLGRVLLVAGSADKASRVGSPGVEGAVVRAEVVEHFRGEKIIVFRYKSKVRYRRKTGHRQSLTRLRITDILLDGESTVMAEVPASVDRGAQDETAASVRPDQEPAEPTAAPTPHEGSTPTEQLPAAAAEAGPQLPDSETDTDTDTDTASSTRPDGGS